MGMPVVTVASGGLPVVDVTATTAKGLWVTEATNGRGVAVTKVVGKPGLPVVYASFAAVAAPPVLLNAKRTNISPAPTEVKLTFDKPLNTGSVPLPAHFLLVRNFVGRAPQTVAITAPATVVLTMDADYGDPAGGTVSYTPGTPPLLGTNGMPVAAITNYPIDP